MEKLYLGAGRQIITPEVGGHLFGYNPDILSEAVADDLTATALYFRQGAVQAMMISLTICNIGNDLATSLREEISRRTGVPAQNILISAVHTHSGPTVASAYGWGDADRPYIENILTPGILKAAQQAAANLQPVVTGVARAKSFVGINRRELKMDSHQVALGQNEWGPFNPCMTVFSFKAEDGTTVANLIHYGCHGTAAGKNHEITRDWCGAMIDALDARTGGITAFFNGSVGDVGPRISNGKTIGDHSMTYVKELGQIAARDAIAIYDRIDSYTELELQTASGEIGVPLKSRVSKEFAQQELEKYKGETVNWRGKLRLYYETVLQSYEYSFTERDAVTFSQILLRLGDYVFASFPYETFSEIELRINKAVEGKTVLAVNLANGSIGYFVTEDALCRGGYEVNMFLHGDVQPYCDHADFELIKATVNHVNAFLGQETK